MKPQRASGMSVASRIGSKKKLAGMINQERQGLTCNIRGQVSSVQAAAWSPLFCILFFICNDSTNVRAIEAAQESWKERELVN